MKFLTKVTSQNGMNLITGIRSSGSWFQRWVDFSNEEATNKAIADAEKECTSVYFALGAFSKDDTGRLARKAKNCNSMRSFFLDIDCAAEKVNKHDLSGHYINQIDATVALIKFTKDTGLPAPTYVISSGKGLHVYWALDRDIPAAEWRRYAFIFKDTTRYYGLKADPARTADLSSILCVPGTLHKSGARVQPLRQSTLQIINADTMLNRLDELAVTVQSTHALKQKDIMLGLDKVPDYFGDEKSILDFPEIKGEPSFFGKIIRMQEVEGTGCKQLYDLYINQEKAPEPLWSAALSICKFTQDGDEWAVKISENYAGYDEYEMRKKMEQWEGPRTCNWFKQERPEMCNGCPHFNKSDTNVHFSPIILGTKPDDGPVEVTAPIAVKSAGSFKKGSLESFVIPTMPYGFKRDPKGGILMQVEKDDDTNEDGEQKPDGKKWTRIFSHDLYVFDRIGFDGEGKPRFWARYHSPQDGVIEFELTTDDIYCTPAVMKQRLAAKNVLFDPFLDNPKHVCTYLQAEVAKLQREKPMAIAPMQLGWTDRGSFVLGRHEVKADASRVVPISSTNTAQRFANALNPHFATESELDQWNKCLQTLYGAADAGLYRLILAAGVGSVIRSRYGHEVGGLLNMYSEDSGLGKTTLSKVMASFYGDPTPFVLQAKHGATNTAFFETISYVNSLPLILDETGQLDAYALMEFIHTSTSGKPKLRASASANDVRQTLDGWRSFVISSSNVSLWNRIVEERSENEAYLMRVVEIPLQRLEQHSDRSLTDGAIRSIEKLAGVCNMRLIQHILQNDEALESQWLDTVARLSSKAGLSVQHRFWVDIIASAVIGASVGYDAGVFPFSPDDIERTAIKVLRDMAARVSDKTVSDEQLLSDLVNENLDKTIAVGDTTKNSPIIVPRTEIQMRYETITGDVYISERAVKKFARDHRFGVERLENYMRAAGAVSKVKKAMGANAGIGFITTLTNTWYIPRDVAKKLNINITFEELKDAKNATNGESPF